MKKYLIFLAIFLLSVVGFAQDKSFTIDVGRTLGDMSFTAADTLNESEEYWVEFNCAQDYPSTQSVYIDIDSIAGDPHMYISLWGKKFAGESYTSIGDSVSWFDASDTTLTISNTTANRYRYYAVYFRSNATAQTAQVSDIIFKIWYTGGSISESSFTDGTLTMSAGSITGAVDITMTGDLIVGDDADVVADLTAGTITSDATIISTTDITAGDDMTVTDDFNVDGNSTLEGTLTVTGLITANGGVTLGAADDLIGSSTSDITINTTAFTVDGNLGDVSVGNDLSVTGDLDVTGDLSPNTITQAQTATANTYTWLQYNQWSTGADMAAGGTYGIYGKANVGHTVQNAIGGKGAIKFLTLAADESINYGSGFEATLELDDVTTHTLTVTDHVSALNLYFDGRNKVEGVGGGTYSKMNLSRAMWNSIDDFSIETNGYQLETVDGSYLDYGFNFYNSGTTLSGIWLHNNALLGGTMTQDITFQNGEALNNVVDKNFISTGNFIKQCPSPTAINSTDNITAAQMLGGVITSTSGSATTLTTPTATAIMALIPSGGRGTTFDLIIDNSAGSSTVTLTLDGSISVNTPAITGGDALTVSTANCVGLFRFYFVSATAAKVFRIY